MVIVGSLIALAASHFLAIPLLLVGAPLAGLGILGGILTYRGPRRFALERRIEENRLATDELLDRIRKLPPKTPPYIRDDLWRKYMTLTQGFEKQVGQRLLHGRETGSVRQLLPENEEKGPAL